MIVPEECFQSGHVLLLTTNGEFILKNLVLMTAGLVVAGTLSRRPGSAAAARLAA